MSNRDACARPQPFPSWRLLTSPPNTSTRRTSGIRPRSKSVLMASLVTVEKQTSQTHLPCCPPPCCSRRRRTNPHLPSAASVTIRTILRALPSALGRARTRHAARIPLAKSLRLPPIPPPSTRLPRLIPSPRAFRRQPITAGIATTPAITAPTLHLPLRPHIPPHPHILPRPSLPSSTRRHRLRSPRRRSPTRGTGTGMGTKRRRRRRRARIRTIRRNTAMGRTRKFGPSTRATDIRLYTTRIRLTGTKKTERKSTARPRRTPEASRVYVSGLGFPFLASLRCAQSPSGWVPLFVPDLLFLASGVMCPLPPSLSYL